MPLAMFLCHGGEQPVRHLSVARRSANSLFMTFRHAVALALVGWYLMLLPKGNDLHIFDVPWSATARSYDTAKECEEARAKAVVPPTPSVATEGKSSPPVERAFYCVATDDPRIRSEVK